jgi:hypothetical protein
MLDGCGSDRLCTPIVSSGICVCHIAIHVREWILITTRMMFVVVCFAFMCEGEGGRLRLQTLC